MGVVVICLIVAIALPLYAIRAKRSEQASVKTQLLCIGEAEKAHRASYGAYTTDETRLTNWRHRTKKYHFRIRHASSTRFVAEANGDLNNDRIFDDTWTIDENGVLTNVK